MSAGEFATLPRCGYLATIPNGFAGLALRDGNGALRALASGEISAARRRVTASCARAGRARGDL
jgi:hypothetical protein